jgi:pantetheine-phosphate adenylyltransferase
MSDRTHLAVYPGTFDPITNGHLDLILRGASIFDALIVAVVDPGPRGHFTLAERLRMIEQTVGDLESVTVEPFEGLLVQFAKRRGAKAILRGVRGVRDFEYEMEMAWANHGMAPELETVFLAPSPESALVSSSLVREVASLGGDVSLWVPPVVAEALGAKPPSLPGAEGARKEE